MQKKRKSKEREWMIFPSKCSSCLSICKLVSCKIFLWNSLNLNSSHEWLITRRVVCCSFASQSLGFTSFHSLNFATHFLARSPKIKFPTSLGWGKETKSVTLKMEQSVSQTDGHVTLDPVYQKRSHEQKCTVNSEWSLFVPFIGAAMRMRYNMQLQHK